jgi:hypothetical protein
VAVIGVFGGVLVLVVEDKLRDDDPGGVTPETVVTRTTEPDVAQAEPRPVSPNPAEQSLPSAGFSAEPTEFDTQCQDTSENTRGTVCITPPIGNPGTPFEVSGYDFPPDQPLILIEENGAMPAIHFRTNPDGTFSEIVETDDYQCMTYEMRLNEASTQRLTGFEHKTLGC